MLSLGINILSIVLERKTQTRVTFLQILKNNRIFGDEMVTNILLVLFVLLLMIVILFKIASNLFLDFFLVYIFIIEIYFFTVALKANEIDELA